MPTEIDLNTMSVTRTVSSLRATGSIDSIQDQNERVWSLHGSLVDAAISFLRKVRDANLDLQVRWFCVFVLRSPHVLASAASQPN